MAWVKAILEGRGILPAAVRGLMMVVCTGAFVGKPFAALAQPAGAPAAQPGDHDDASGKSPTVYGARLANLEASDWRAAFALGQQIAGLPPEEGWAVMRDNWARVGAPETKQQLLKAWNYGEGMPLKQRSHPHLLDVLDLGVRDQSPKVQEWAMNFLRSIAFQDFALDFEAYQTWFAKYHQRPTVEVQTESCRAWVDRVKAMKTDAEFISEGSLMDRLGHPFRDTPAVATAALEAGVVEALEPWVQRATMSGRTLERPAQSAMTLIGQMDLDRGRLERVVVPLLDKKVPNVYRERAARILGKPANTWAVPLLLTTLVDMAAPSDRPEPGMGHMTGVAQALAEVGSPAAIPTMIGVIDANNAYETVYGVGYFGLGPLTGVKYDDSHNGAWWREWWEKNKAKYPEAVRALTIPELPRRAAAPKKAAADEQAEAPPDIADIPFKDLRAGGDEKKRYFLIGPRAGAKAPAAGYRLVLILPGGEGNADFRPFVQRMLKNALPNDCVVADLVAPKWSDAKDRIVWPTLGLKDENAKFATEDFITAVIEDVKAKVTIDPKRIDAMGWSSGGPPVYSVALREGSPIRGAFVAMSVFKPESLPPLAGAAGHRFYILHSPQDFIPMSFPKDAQAKLAAAGGKTTLQTYEGGHGWHGDIYATLTDGFMWLDKKGE